MLHHELMTKAAWWWVGGRRWANLDVSDEDWAIIKRVLPYTLTPVSRLAALIAATRYVVRDGIRGDLVECGVWRGGSSMAMALTLKKELSNRSIWMYDTFEGMPVPGEKDTSKIAWIGGMWRQRMGLLYRKASGWCAVDFDEVVKNLHSTNYHEVFLVKGKVEDTLTRSFIRPQKIALLRLDTDWYESTKVELEVLWPRVVPGGFLIIDDYGHWDGARKAVDEYFGPNIYKHRVDYSCRIIRKEA